MSEIKPVRLQRSRRRGARLASPNGLPVIYVGRPTRWGNPFRVAPEESSVTAVFRFRDSLTNQQKADIRRELRGKNLACWCHETDCCHADILLAIANEGVEW